MSDERSSVTQWLVKVKEGDDDAARKLWERHQREWVRRALSHLRGLARRAADEEDVALSAFAQFCDKAEAGGFGGVQDREEFGRVMTRLLRDHAIDLLRRERAASRGGGKVRGDSAHEGVDAGLDQHATDGLPPDVLVAGEEEFSRLLEVLGDEQMRRIAVMRMEEYSNGEIAAELGVSVATVERRLAMIRTAWGRLE